jgi:hypothetical protein
MMNTPFYKELLWNQKIAVTYRTSKELNAKIVEHWATENDPRFHKACDGMARYCRPDNDGWVVVSHENEHYLAFGGTIREFLAGTPTLWVGEYEGREYVSTVTMGPDLGDYTDEPTFYTEDVELIECRINV